MPDYQKMYGLLFNAVTDAVRSIQRCNYGEAGEILIRAQEATEELYVTSADLPADANE